MSSFGQPVTIQVGVNVIVHPSFKGRYPEHHDKIFKVLDIDDEDYCELEWINVNAPERIAYILRDHLQIS